MIIKLSDEKDDITATFSKLGKDVESIHLNLQEMFPNIECVQLMSKAIEANSVDESCWDSIYLLYLKEFNETIKPHNLTKHKLFPSQKHLIQEQMKMHYCNASDQFHKMLSKMTNIDLPRKQVFNPSDAIQSITNIHNEKLESAILNQKEAFKQQKKVDWRLADTSSTLGV
jgi:hypothetical protein